MNKGIIVCMVLMCSIPLFSGCVQFNDNEDAVPLGYTYSPLLTQKLNRIYYPPGTPMPVSMFDVGYRVYTYSQKDAEGNLPIKIYRKEYGTNNLTFSFDALVLNGSGLFASENYSIWQGAYVFNRTYSEYYFNLTHPGHEGGYGQWAGHSEEVLINDWGNENGIPFRVVSHAVVAHPLYVIKTIGFILEDGSFNITGY